MKVAGLNCHKSVVGIVTGAIALKLIFESFIALLRRIPSEGGAVDRSEHKRKNGLRFGKPKTISVRPFCRLFKQSCSCLSMAGIKRDRQQMTKSSTYNELRTFDRKLCTILLIFKTKRVTDKMLPCGTPISWSNLSDRWLPTLTRNLRLFKNLAIKSGIRPRRPAGCVMEIAQDAVFPRRVVCLFKVKENRHDVVSADKASRI